MEKKCELCNNIFTVNIKNKRSCSKRFCCGTCAKRHNGKNNIGKKRTEEYKQKLSEKLKGEVNPFYGKVHSKISKDKISKANTKDILDLQTTILSKNEIEILNGILLADGHLELSSNGHSARLTYGCEFIETLYNVIEAFPNMEFSPIWQSSKTQCYHIKSSFYKSLGDLHKIWYTPIKIVPSNVIITPLSCFWWFIGDGYRAGNSIKLCTDSFINTAYILVDKLKTVGINSRITNDRNRIRIDKDSIDNFLEWIVTGNIPSQYLYKWTKDKKCKKLV